MVSRLYVYEEKKPVKSELVTDFIDGKPGGGGASGKISPHNGGSGVSSKVPSGALTVNTSLNTDLKIDLEEDEVPKNEKPLKLSVCSYIKLLFVQ